MEPNKKLEVSAIEEGSVIDHIPADALFNVIKILDLKNFKNLITFGTNFDSKKLGKKGIIKIANKFFDSEEVNKIALFAPKATLVVIKNYNVIKKTTLTLPKEIFGFIKCINPNCITNYENITTRFKVLSNNKEVKLKCHYCEKITEQKNIEIIS